MLVIVSFVSFLFGNLTLSHLKQILSFPRHFTIYKTILGILSNAILYTKTFSTCNFSSSSNAGKLGTKWLIFGSHVDAK